MAVIQTKNLTKYYGKARGIIELDLSVNEGEVFGFLGPNGAGKTTTIRALMGYLRATSGSAEIFGMDSFKDALAIRQRLGNLPGELALYPKLTGKQMIQYLAHLRGGVDWAYVEELAERLDMDMSRKIQQLSHGNKQKLGLIQALMSKPDLLVLDEPTTGLDPLIQQTFYELIDEAKANGQTVFLSSHILPEVERVCDRVGIIREGKLITVESVADLKAKAISRLEFTFADEISAKAFEKVEGVKDVQVTDSRVLFTVEGALDAVVKAAAQYTVVNIRSEEPHLEEIFLAFYGREVNNGNRK